MKKRRIVLILMGCYLAAVPVNAQDITFDETEIIEESSELDLSENDENFVEESTIEEVDNILEEQEETEEIEETSELSIEEYSNDLVNDEITEEKEQLIDNDLNTENDIYEADELDNLNELEDVQREIEIVQQPVDFIGNIGDTAEFQVLGEGECLTYQWQYSVNGNKWYNSSVKGKTYRTLLSEERNGRMIRCVINDVYGNSITSDVVKMSIQKGEIMIFSQPEDYTGVIGSTAEFRVEAEGAGLSYQWQYSTNGTKWYNSSVKGAVYRSILSEDRDGRMIRCIIKDANGNSAVSDVAKMIVCNAEIKIINQPENYIGIAGSTAEFKIEAEGTGLTYQWQYSVNGTKWYNSSVKGDVYKSTLSQDRDGRMVRCIVKDIYGNSEISDAVKMIIRNTEITITSQPQNYTGVVGSTAEFSIEATGENLSYQWQYSANGIKWYNSSAKGAKYRSVLTEDRDGRKIRCVVNDEYGNSVISDEAKMIVASIKVLRVPEEYYGKTGDKVTFEVVAQGSELSYQWQLSDNEGKSWRNSSIQNSSYTTTLTESNSGRLIRCRITDSYGNEYVSEPVKLAVSEQFIEGFIDRNGKTYYRYSNGDYARGLVEIEGETYYFNEKNDSMYKGFIVLNNVRYYFDDESGKAVKGLKYVESNGNTYYFQGAKGAAVGLLDTDEGLRYFNPSGIMLTGMQTVNENIFYFDVKTGLAEQGFFQNPSTGQLYYFDGKNGAVKNRFYEVEGETYFCGKDGAIARGLTRIGGKRYYFNTETGAQEKGVISVGYGKIIYIGEDGTCASGLQKINDKYYYFDPEVNLAVSGMKKIGEDVYYFDDETGEAQKGFIKIENNTYYFADDYKMVTGINEINGELYYFDDSGKMYTGILKEDNVRYYFDKDTGNAISGWSTAENGYIYYYDPKTHKALTGEKIIDNKKYFFYDTGVLRTGIVRDSTNNTYYYTANGEIGKGFIVIGGKTYYFDEESQLALSGIHEIEGKKYYFNQWGMMRSGKIEAEEGTYYFSYEDGSAVSGFLTSDTGARYYYDPQTNLMVTGLNKINGELYYFGENGVMQSGYCKVADQVYYFDKKTGQAITGFGTYVNSEGTKSIIYADPVTKQLVRGLTNIDKELYLFSDAGILKTGVQTVEGKTYYFDPITGKAQKGFVEISTGKINYYDKNGERVSGKQVIDNNVYIFSDAGTRLTGMISLDNLRYWIDKETGIALSGKIVNSGNGKIYMLLPNGGNASGLVSYWGTDAYADASTGIMVVSRTTVVNNLQYYFDENGERLYGMIEYTASSGEKTTKYFGKTENVSKASEIAQLQEEIIKASSIDGWHEIGGLTYYVSDGKYASGIVEIDGKKYGFSTKTNVLLTGLRTINGEQYYFNDLGEMQTGFITIDNQTRYFADDTGKMVTGFQRIGNKKYYFLSNGVLASGKIVIGDKEYLASEENSELVTDDRNYDKEGILKKNCWENVNGDEYYIDASGEYLKGIYLIDSKYYCFDANGKKYTGFYSENNSTKYFGENGMETGWNEINGDKYYFNLKDGSMYIGINIIDGKKYYFDENGRYKQGFIKFAGGTTRYFDENGMVTGKQKIENKEYYFNEYGEMQTGLITIADKVFYYNTEGIKEYGEINYCGQSYYFDEISGEQISGLVERNGKTYYYNPTTGTRATGLYEIDGKRYFFDEDNGERILGFVNNANKIYYLDDSAKGYVNGLQEIDGKLYYFSEDGVVMTGARIIDSVRYYFDPVTGQSIDKVISLPNGDAYYVKEGGGISYGFQSIDGRTFYFYPTNGKKINGLQSIGDKLYYFDEQEGMLKNTSVTISGITYTLNSEGEASVKVTNEISDIIQNGLAYLGTPYKKETEEGDKLSCSGFMRLLFANKEIDLSGSCYQQCYNLMHNSEYQIIDDIADAKAGDLVFYTCMDCPYGEECGFWNEVHHVAMYLDEGKVFHATPHGNADHPELDCVQIENLTGSEQFTPYVIIRVM